MRRRVLSTLVTVPILALSACGGGDDSDSVKPVKSVKSSASAPAAPPETPTATPSAEALPTTTPEAAEIAVSVLGSSAAKTADEKAAVDAWMTYWQAVSTSLNELEPAAGLDSARGEPLTETLDYLNELKTKNHRNVGWVRDHVLAVKVSGDTAAIRDCAENFSFVVDSANKPVEKIWPFLSINGLLTKDGDRWVVTMAKTTTLDKDCRA